jgi:hypothetical protein
MVDVSDVIQDIADVRHETAEDACRINENVTRTGWHVSDVSSREGDRVTHQASFYAMQQQNRDFVAVLDNAKSHAQTQLLVAQDGEKTRALLNQTTIDDLRMRLQFCQCCGHRGNGNGNGNGNG